MPASMRDSAGTNEIPSHSPIPITASNQGRAGSFQQPEKRRIVYLGGFIDEAIVQERGLKSHNAAGSNRMYRISRALKSAGYRPVLFSPATSLRARSHQAILHRLRMRAHKGIPVVFAAAFNVVGLNVFSSLFFQFFALRALLRSGRVGGAVIYNFNPALVILTAYLKFIRRLPVLHNVEDVSEPSFRDWFRATEARPVQQLVFYVCMNLIARMSDSYVVPTRRFLGYLPAGKPAVVVTGCIDTDTSVTTKCRNSQVRILFAGKIEREHGIEQFVQALKLLDVRVKPNPFRVDITGTGGMADWMQTEISGLRNVKAVNHGFVSQKAYQELLFNAQICVALQDPKGRYADYKTPSKVYEFLGFGKAVIATDVGDLSEIPDDTIVVIETLSAQAIAEQLEQLVAEPGRVEMLRKSAKRHAQENYSYAAVGIELRNLMTQKRRGKP